MRVRRRFLLLVTLSMLAIAGTALAGSPDPARLGVLTYRLADTSIYVDGCVPPCRCAIRDAAPIRFDSGIVDGADPPSLDITLYDEGDGCVNQALHLVATPLP